MSYLWLGRSAAWALCTGTVQGVTPITWSRKVQCGPVMFTDVVAESCTLPSPPPPFLTTQHPSWMETPPPPPLPSLMQQAPFLSWWGVLVCTEAKTIKMSFFFSTLNLSAQSQTVLEVHTSRYSRCRRLHMHRTVGAMKRARSASLRTCLGSCR